MDGDSDWTNTGLFSPSKAKAHQAQAKDWAFVDSWLTKRSASKRLPAFERNEDTLEALLSLATLNDAADEQRNAIDRVEKAAYSAQVKRAEATADGLHDLLLSQLGGKADLDLLAELSVMLNTPRNSALNISTALVDLQDAQFSSDQLVRRTEAQLRALEAEQNRLETLLANVRGEPFQPSSALSEQTTEWGRSSKHLRAKIGEYDDRLAGTRSESKPTIAFHDVKKHVTDLDDHSLRLKQLEDELQAFQSLPSDAKSARSKLEAAREELRTSTKQRDELFEKLAGT